MKTRYDTLKQAGYVSAKSLGNGEVMLTDTEGKMEIWVCSKNHASYGIKYKNTHLEFARSLPRASQAVQTYRETVTEK
jgi:hypothetical protein